MEDIDGRVGPTPIGFGAGLGCDEETALAGMGGGVDAGLEPGGGAAGTLCAVEGRFVSSSGLASGRGGCLGCAGFASTGGGGGAGGIPRLSELELDELPNGSPSVSDSPPANGPVGGAKESSSARPRGGVLVGVRSGVDGGKMGEGARGGSVG